MQMPIRDMRRRYRKATAPPLYSAKRPRDVVDLNRMLGWTVDQSVSTPGNAAAVLILLNRPVEKA